MQLDQLLRHGSTTAGPNRPHDVPGPLMPQPGRRGAPQSQQDIRGGREVAELCVRVRDIQP
jgi:hypothetical protein